MLPKRPLNLPDFAGQPLVAAASASECSSASEDSEDSSSDASSDAEPAFSSVFLFSISKLTGCKWHVTSAFIFQERAEDVPTDVPAILPATGHAAPEDEVRVLAIKIYVCYLKPAQLCRPCRWLLEV